MKILYATHQFYPETSGGTEHFLLNLAHSMQRAGHHADVVTYTQADLATVDRGAALQKREYMYARLRVMSFRHPKPILELNTAPQDSQVASFAREYLRQQCYDLLHVVHPMRVCSFATAAAELRLPYVVTLTDFWTLCPKITLQTSYGSLCAGPDGGRACANLCPELSFECVKSRLSEIYKFLRGASAVVAPSQFSAALTRKQYADIEVSVIPHGLSRKNFPKSAKRYASDSPIVFAYCGGLAPHKGAHLLISAFRKVSAPHVSLRIFGVAGPNDKSYERELRKLASGDPRVEFRGAYRPQEAGAILQSVDVVLIPSLWYETYSLSLHEAFACGIPVIASDVGVLAESVKAGDNGFTFPLGDEIGLTQHLNRIAANPALLNAMKENLKSFVPAMEEEEAYLYERLYRRPLVSLLSGA